MTSDSSAADEPKSQPDTDAQRLDEAAAPDGLGTKASDKNAAIVASPTVQESILHTREQVRGHLATSLIYLVIGTAAGAFLVAAGDYANAVRRNEDPDRALAKDIITLLLTSNSALAGAALGFYFGDKGSGSGS